MTLFLRSDLNELLPLGVQGIPLLRTLLTRLHLPDDKSRPQHPHYPHIPENALRIGSHFASRPAFQDRAMPFFVVHDTHQGLPAMGILFQFGQPAVDFAQGALVPLKVQKVFCHCIHICGVIPPKASGAAEWRASQSPNPQKICRNSVRTSAGRRFYLDGRGRKKIHPRLTACFAGISILPLFQLFHKYFSWHK